MRAATRLGIAVSAGLAVALLLPASSMWQLRLVAGWNAFALPSLLLMWTAILTLRPAEIRHVAQREDPGRVVALVMAVVGGAAALLAVVLLLEASRRMHPWEEHLALALALPAVASAWALTHTVFTLRYAHEYYGELQAKPALIFPASRRRSTIWTSPTTPLRLAWRPKLLTLRSVRGRCAA